ncbi:MAG: flagellar hook-associated protein FlgL [Deltaproteobacteria bacterium]|nr:flagellar hook-associated protein FlgL [Deltaproteobacteria bacterium]
MRITQNITYNTYINDIMRKQESLYGLSRQISSGKKVNVLSDDPVSAESILSARGMISTFDQYEKNIDSGLSRLSMAEESLSGVENALMSIRETAVSQSTGTANAQTRSAAATVVSNLFDQIISLANTSFDNKYIFSGYKTDTPPFESTGAYQGDANSYRIRAGENAYVTAGVNGGEVFKGLAGGVDVLQTVSDLKAALNANDTTGIQTAITNLETSFNQITDAVSDIGGKVVRLNASKETLTNFKLGLKTALSELEDADMTKAISELSLGQVALEAAISSAGKVFSINIFDYL